MPRPIDTAREVKMMSSPGEWPQWPVLPVKRYVGGENWPECAFMFAQTQPIVYRGNLFAIDGKGKTWDEVLSQFETKEYPTFEAAVADGWVVD